MRCSVRRLSSRRLQGPQAAYKGFGQQAARRLRAAAVILPHISGDRVKDHIMIQNEVLNEKATLVPLLDLCLYKEFSSFGNTPRYSAQSANPLYEQISAQSSRRFMNNPGYPG
jgi:hypothetical protein